eukprot:scaffold176391_cov31-Tisochrysis_lutea.AAC.4
MGAIMEPVDPPPEDDVSERSSPDGSDAADDDASEEIHLLRASGDGTGHRRHPCAQVERCLLYERAESGEPERRLPLSLAPSEREQRAEARVCWDDAHRARRGALRLWRGPR